ncbi:hypothetical protein V8F06_000052 [Rhypophila decipiens]
MSQLGMPAAAPADNDDRFPILPKPDGTDHGEGAGEDKTIDQQASTKPSTVIDPSTSSSTLPASTSASSQSNESPTVPKKKVRHSGTIVYIPPPEEIKDRDRENSDASCAEKVHTKPKTQKSSGWLPDSELGCVVCVIASSTDFLNADMIQGPASASAFSQHSERGSLTRHILAGNVVSEDVETLGVMRDCDLPFKREQYQSSYSGCVHDPAWRKLAAARHQRSWYRRRN